eukprot:PhF_6_TR13351/c0_g1_i1/m.21146
MPKPVVLFVTVEIDPSKRNGFLSVIEHDAKESRKKEPGCLAFDVIQSDKIANTYHFYEVYTDERAVAFHRSTPHYKKWNDFKEAGGVKSLTVVKGSALIHPSGPKKAEAKSKL